MRERRIHVSSPAAEQYLARAKAAEAVAVNLPEGDLRDAWIGVADSYRELAESEVLCPAD